MTTRLRKETLMAPGPTQTPPEVLLAGAMPLYHHRTKRFTDLFGRAGSGLKMLFQTENDVYTLASSGTGAMEMAVVNLVAPGEKAIVVEGGKFGERFRKICEAYQVNVILLKIENGEAIDPAVVKKAIDENPDAKACFIQFSETSTGCIYDIEAIGKITAPTNTLLVVDGISGIAAQEFYMDKWNVDVAIAGSQKGLMLPPGLAFISLNARAWKQACANKRGRFYFDLKLYKKGWEQSDSPFTPATTLIIQLEKSLQIIAAETMQGVWARHEWMASATRNAMEALGLELFAKRPGNILTAVKVPDGVDGVQLVKTLRDYYGVTFAGGQGEMKGQIFRFGHLGYADRMDVITGVAGVEMTLKKLGWAVKMGEGVRAAEEVLLKEPGELNENTHM